MIDEVKRYIEENNMLEIGDKVVAGVSGGADSTALLELLCLLRDEYKLSLYAVHINHGIRAEAFEDALYVNKLCKDRGVPFYLFEENIPAIAKREHLSEEEAGRYYRYQCFYKVMRETGAEKLAVAHHMDDQAETVLFHLVRGTDLKGVSGMMPVSVADGRLFSVGQNQIAKGAGDTICQRKESGTDDFHDSIMIIRPLLNISKDEIRKWLQDRDISWQEDATNNDESYARNRIRNSVINALTIINPEAPKHIAEFAKLAAGYDNFIKEQALSFIEREALLYIGDGNELSRDIIHKNLIAKEVCLTDIVRIKARRRHLLSADRVIADRVLYEMLTMIAGARKDISREHVKALYDLLSKQSGKELSMPYGVKAALSYEWLILETDTKTDLASDSIEINLTELKYKENLSIKLSDREKIVLRLIDMDAEDNDSFEKMKKFFGKGEKNYTKYFDCDTIDNTLQIRCAGSEDYFICDRNGHRKKLSKHFKDIKLPACERKNIQVLACGLEVLWVPGGRRCEAYQVTEDSKTVLEAEYIISN